MTSETLDARLSDAVFYAVKDGTYPEDESVVSAELQSSALDRLQNLLENAREEVKDSIRELSRLSAPDVDGWISQAKQLRADIESSQTLSQEIVSLAEEGKILQSSIEDAAAKAELLKGEIDFNEHLYDTLQQIFDLRNTLDSARQAVVANELPVAIALLKKADRELSELPKCENTTLAGLVRAKCGELHREVADTVTVQWNTLISVDRENRQVSIRKDLQRPENSSVTLDAVIAALSALNLLHAKIMHFQKEFDEVIFTPRVRQRTDGTVATWDIGNGSVRISGRMPETSTSNLFSDLTSMVELLSANLPSSIAGPFSEAFLPYMTSNLVDGPLSSSVPPDLDSIPAFVQILDQAKDFISILEKHGWRGKNHLVQWVEDAPRSWLTRRSEYSLHMVRALLVRGLGDSRTVERVETQLVTKDDDIFANNETNEDWNAEWSDNDEPDKQEQDTTIIREPDATNGEEEDVSAWGLDDDHSKVEFGGDESKEAEDEGDAWGWGDDDKNEESPTSQRPPALPERNPTRNGNVLRAPPAERQVTLKETYNITALPEQILEIIIEVVMDAQTLAQSSLTENPVAPAAKDLFSLPGLLLSMYRASAPTFYAQNICGNMFLYNDSLYITEKLRSFAEHQAKRNPSMTASNAHFDADISALELFGKRCYGKEMESQRTIIGDLLDGAQGFANSTEQPFAQQCELAISSTVDRLREIHAQWKPVLSHSALLQSIGSLLGTALNKIIIDIEDLSDISEPESQRLTAFCNRVIALKNLFLPEGEAGGENAVPRTAVYTPHWLKFQYLVNILESSLADIKYLWMESELSLEFGKEELIDLIEALFADSEHRRRAIGEIRRGERGR